MANSCQLVNLVQDKQMRRLNAVFSNEEMIIQTRVQIAEAFIIVAKNKGLRKIFFQRDLLTMLFYIAFMIVNEQKKAKPSNLMPFIQTTIRLLCIICTMQKT